MKRSVIFTAIDYTTQKGKIQIKNICIITEIIYIITEACIKIRQQWNDFMAEKLIFRKRIVRKKDIQEIVYTNCSSDPPDNPGILRLRHMGKTILYPRRSYKNDDGENKEYLLPKARNPEKNPCLLFSTAFCPVTIRDGSLPKSRLGAGKVIFISPGSTSKLILHNETEENAVRYYLLVERNVNMELLFSFTEANIFDTSDPVRSMQCTEELFSMLENSSSYTARDISLKLFEFFTLLRIPQHKQRGFSGPYRDLFQRISGDPGNFPTIRSLKNLFHLSEKTLIKVFHAHTGRSPMSFVIYCRLYNSCWQLTETTMAIEEVAFLAGYPNPAFYSKAFKKEFGLSPSQYRKRSGRV